jgi:hypothetical protein
MPILKLAEKWVFNAGAVDGSGKVGPEDEDEDDEDEDDDDEPPPP